MKMKKAEKTMDETLHFEDSEHFGLFMEGLRALREHSREAEKDSPDRDKLRLLLDEAIKRLEKCESDHPEDVLPQYCLGLALTMKNQLHYAEMLRDNAERFQSLDDRQEWPLLDHAETLFRQVINSRQIQLKNAARFNTANVLAKRGAQNDLEEAKRELDTLSEEVIEQLLKVLS